MYITPSLGNNQILVLETHIAPLCNDITNITWGVVSLLGITFTEPCM